jgi:hypothetical protein
MKFASGCLSGLLLGILLSALAFVGYTLFSSNGLVPLSPASSGTNPDLTITMSQQYLNDQLRTGLAARGMRPSDLTVALHSPNRAEATMTMPLTVLGQTLNVQSHASLHFGLANGSITLELDQVDVSGLGIPQAIVNQEMGTLMRYADDQLNTEMRRMLAGTGLHVVGIAATEGALTVQLSR